MGLLVLLAAGCIGGETPAADTLHALDRVCAVREAQREVSDGAAQAVDTQVRELGEQPAVAAPADADAGVGGSAPPPDAPPEPTP